MADYKLIGKNYTTPDLVAKVTGKAKYAEDYRAEGMLFCKLLLSPRPHARVTRIDASAALAMPGVHAILTADDMPAPPPPPGVPAAPPAPAAQGGARGGEQGGGPATGAPAAGATGNTVQGRAQGAPPSGATTQGAAPAAPSAGAAPPAAG